MLLKIILTLLLINGTGNVYFADRPFFNVEKIDEAAAPKRINMENVGVDVAAKRFVAIDVNSGKLLLQKDSNLRQPIASITKLMTALVILEMKPDWNSEVEMQKSDETIGAFPHLYRGERLKFVDLWKSALIASDNNAIRAMIRGMGMSEADFVAKMNAKAVALDMANSDFADPTGLSELNLSTAQDVARLIHFAMQKNEIRESVLQPSYSFRILNNNKFRKINNTDILLGSFLNDKKHGYELIGGKTGYLFEAGYCLGVEIENNHRAVVIVVLDSPNIDQRFQDVKVIADWVYSNYAWQ